MDGEDEYESGGIWSSARDRKEWLSLMGPEKCRTVGATSLGLYLFGDRAVLYWCWRCAVVLHVARVHACVYVVETKPLVERA